ncbi:hypothetical protein [Nocardioides limicola]|uniref:hypothetical protein n=1 Tax=Nocardioides limicola TaxID=2803368 RepID=UPI00193C3AB4|nr:hypothetical protein [Nocardioides sp. DJM-14]
MEDWVEAVRRHLANAFGADPRVRIEVAPGPSVEVTATQDSDHHCTVVVYDVDGGARYRVGSVQIDEEAPGGADLEMVLRGVVGWIHHARDGWIVETLRHKGDRVVAARVQAGDLTASWSRLHLPWGCATETVRYESYR